MKKYLLLLSFLIMVHMGYSQITNVAKPARKVVTLDEPHIPPGPVLCIFTLRSDTMFLYAKPDEAKEQIKLVAPWVTYLDVLKDPEEIKKYGDKGKNGVIFIKLKPEAWEELPDSVRMKFRHVENILPSLD